MTHPATRDFLRKDYRYLFERFFNFVNAQLAHERGVVVFDEIEKAQSHILVGQMSAYFLRTSTGQSRSRRVVPEPFFVQGSRYQWNRFVRLGAFARERAFSGP